MATYIATGNRVDYTPSSAVSAGDVVVLEDMIGIATEDIAASALGSLAVEGIFEFDKDSGSSTDIDQGTDVYWDATNEVITATASTHNYAGKVVADAATTVSVVKVKLCPCKL